MDPHRVNALWLEGELGPVERMSIASYLHHGYEINLWSYGSPRVSDGVIRRDAREILPLPILTYQQPQQEIGNPLLHVNLFRYKFLYERGGCFTELDQICLGSLPDGSFISSENAGGAHPNLAVIRLFPWSESMRRCLLVAQERLGESRKGAFGPKLLKECINGEFVAPPEWFCPVPYSNAAHILREPATRLPSEAIGCHLWGAVIRKSGIDVREAQPGSLWNQWRESFKP